MADKKTVWFIVTAVLVLAVIGILALIMAEIKPRGYAPKEIAFGEECAKDGDCIDSFKTCKNGVETSCDNGCVYGRCTKCVPPCPGEPECGNASCMDSIRVCPDGRTARCANYCDDKSHECTVCVPECSIKANDGINYPLENGGIVLDAIPCVDANYTERTEIRIIKKNTSGMELPKGYSAIMEPFTVDYDGAINLTLNIPETYGDVSVLMCKEGECNPIATEQVGELRCGGKVSKEFLQQTEYLEPKLMPVKIKETNMSLRPKGETTSDKYKAEFDGSFDKLSVSLSMPNEAVERAKNPGLVISGTPLVVKINQKVNEGVNSTITMPYTDLTGFEENSIGMYVKVNEGWEYLGGRINEGESTVTARIADISKYLNKNNEMELALMGIQCVSCYGPSLDKVYGASNKSGNMVVLVHGFDPEPNTYQELIDDIKLTNQPFDAWTFNYPSSKSIEENAQDFMDILEKNSGGYENIYIVAHSLGGFVVQEALYNSYLENKKGLEKEGVIKYSYLDKVKKVILAGTGNEGSPVAEVYMNLFKNLVNSKERILFNPNSGVINDMVRGIITPRAPGISYNVVAGTKPYDFNLLFFKISTDELADIYERNDGIITVKSAQHVGDGYINKQCEDYWEVNLTHTELIDDPAGRKIIEKIISEDISGRGSSVLGHSKYFDLTVGNCSKGDTFVVVGKNIGEKAVLDETGCSCGNGYCGEGEDEKNCPGDCAKLLSKDKIGNNFIFIISLLAAAAILTDYVIYRRLRHPHLKSIVEHIKKNYDIVPNEGYSVSDVRNAFLAKGWPKRIVDESMKVLKKEFHNSYHSPLKNHLKKHLKKGYTKEEIKRALIDAGWNEKAVENAFRGEEIEPGFRLKKKHGELRGGGKYFGFNE